MTTRKGFAPTQKFEVGQVVTFEHDTAGILVGTVKICRPYRLAGYFQVHFAEWPAEQKRHIIHQEFLEEQKA